MSSQYYFTIDGQTRQPPSAPAMTQAQTIMLRYFLNRPVTFPQVEKPIVSIIIPVFNQFEYTIACLHSLVNTCAGEIPYEVILADDGSTDQTREISGQVVNLRIIRNESGQHGFLPNVNFATQFARGKYFFLLNNDTLLLENSGLLERLTAHFSDPTVGVVGNCLMNGNGKQTHCTLLYWSDGTFWDFSIPDCPVIEGDAVEGSAFMVPGETWRELSGFDPVYGRGYFEEADLCFRIKTQKHQRIICDMQSKIIHFGQRSFQNTEQTAIEFKKNGKFFFQRWHDYLTGRERDLPDGDLKRKLQALWKKLYSGCH